MGLKGSGIRWLQKKREERREQNELYNEEYRKQYESAKRHELARRAGQQARENARRNAARYGRSRLDIISSGISHANKSLGSAQKQYGRTRRAFEKNPLFSDVFSTQQPKKKRRKKRKTIVIRV